MVGWLGEFVRTGDKQIKMSVLQVPNVRISCKFVPRDKQNKHKKLKVQETGS